MVTKTLVFGILKKLLFQKKKPTICNLAIQSYLHLTLYVYSIKCFEPSNCFKTNYPPKATKYSDTILRFVKLFW